MKRRGGPDEHGLLLWLNRARLHLYVTPRPLSCLPFIGRGDTMGLLRLAVLGPPEAVHNGTRLTFALRKAQALLLYLAIEGGMHSRSKLAALLWPDSEPPAARAALRNALLLLRRLLDNPEASASPHSHLRHERD